MDPLAREALLPKTLGGVVLTTDGATDANGDLLDVTLEIGDPDPRQQEQINDAFDAMQDAFEDNRHGYRSRDELQEVATRIIEYVEVLRADADRAEAEANVLQQDIDQWQATIDAARGHLTTWRERITACREHADSHHALADDFMLTFLGEHPLQQKH